ncbi:hypothetical protein ACIQUY_31865 [Streptomyces sp. NPDC090231]|nr:hypothetical protein OG384_04540 [Streptomyces sp. NBC_01324]WSJ23168.1 hypothetical protein OG384_14840 [Streptomyces sp. NBC_01324]
MTRVEIRPTAGDPWLPVNIPGRPDRVLAAARLMYPRWQHRITTHPPRL